MGISQSSSHIPHSPPSVTVTVIMDCILVCSASSLVQGHLVRDTALYPEWRAVRSAGDLYLGSIFLSVFGRNALFRCILC
jgi:hypothetical protein